MQLVLYAFASDGERHLRTGPKCLDVSVDVPAWGMAIDFGDRVVRCETSALGLTVRLDARDHDGLIEFLDGIKSAIGEYLFRADNLEANLREEIIPGDFANAADVIAEEVSKARVGEGFGGFAHARGVGKKLPMFR